MVLHRLAISIALLVASTSATTADVSISTSDTGELVVRANEVPLDTVLKHLKSLYGFTLEGEDHLRTEAAANATLSGSVDNVISRLLSNWNHVIIHSENDPGKVRKVVIINAEHGTAAASADQANAKAKQQREDFDKAVAGEY